MLTRAGGGAGGEVTPGRAMSGSKLPLSKKSRAFVAESKETAERDAGLFNLYYTVASLHFYFTITSTCLSIEALLCM